MGVFARLFGKKRPTDVSPEARILHSCTHPFTPPRCELHPAQSPAIFPTLRRLAVGLMPDPYGEEPPPDCAGRAVAVLSPDNKATLYYLDPADIPEGHMDVDHSMLPAIPRRRVAVVANTYRPHLEDDPDAAIPFRGYLMSWAALGHVVWVFEGHPQRFADGCRGADLLIVDNGMIPQLPPDWQEVGGEVMSGNELWIHDRDNYRLVKTTLGNVGCHAGGALLSFREPVTVV